MILLTTFIIVGLCHGGRSRPFLPMPYQLLYLSPDVYPDIGQQQRQQVAMANRVYNEPSVSSELENDESPANDQTIRVSQFHSEDGDGRVVYGFRSNDQTRMEAREADGSVQGSYSYIDPTGKVVNMQYWDDGNGIHMAGNNLPVAIHREPEYTPEVRAAREEHFRLYGETLAALLAAHRNVLPQQEPEITPGIVSDTVSSIQPFDEVSEEVVTSSDDKIVVENDTEDKNPFSESQQNLPNQEHSPEEVFPLSMFTAIDNHDDESVAIDNPELSEAAIPLSLLKGISSDGDESVAIDNPELSDEAIPHSIFAGINSDDDESVAIDNPELSDGHRDPATNNRQDSADHYKMSTSDSSRIETKVTSHNTPLQYEENLKETIDSKVSTDVVQTEPSKIAHAKYSSPDNRPLSDERVEVQPENHPFYYHLAYQIPQRTERVDDHFITQLRTHEPISSRVAAVHDSQLSPYQRKLDDSLILPIYIPS